MRIKGAMTILRKRAEDFYGTTSEELVQWMDDGLDQPIKVTQAYEVYKMHHGYVWCGINGFNGWTTIKGKMEEYNVAYNGGHQLELDI